MLLEIVKKYGKPQNVSFLPFYYTFLLYFADDLLIRSGLPGRQL